MTPEHELLEKALNMLHAHVNDLTSDEIEELARIRIEFYIWESVTEHCGR